MFLDIHSQHQTYSFIQPKFHITLLDSYIKSSLLENYKKDYETYKNKLSELENLKQISEKTEEQIDFLRFQVEEIENASLNSINEDEDLNNELSILENAEKLKELTGSSYWSLSGDDNSIMDALFQIKSNITKASNMDNSLGDIESEFINVIENLKEISSSLRDYSSSLENDIETGKNLRKELNGIEFSTQNIENLEQEIDLKRKNLLNLAEKISEERKRYATVLSALIVEKLEKLELPKVRFDIRFEPSELGVCGIDKVEFMISTNISEDLKPLAKVASGGEISRVMLAIKTIFAQADNIDTVIFDEIDTGISGKTSQAVAEEVRELAKYMQIIMITHQAIIASKSEKHIFVRKTQNETTSIDISTIEGEAKLKAIAELASGEVTEESINLAKTLIY